MMMMMSEYLLYRLRLWTRLLGLPTQRWINWCTAHWNSAFSICSNRRQCCHAKCVILCQTYIQIWCETFPTWQHEVNVWNTGFYGHIPGWPTPFIDHLELYIMINSDLYLNICICTEYINITAIQEIYCATLTILYVCIICTSSWWWWWCLVYHHRIFVLFWYLRNGN
jgi:hypothetical protein